MIKIRLSRQGKRNYPFYRIVAIDTKKKQRGKFLDILGYWIPNKKKLEINKKKLDTLLSNGAVLNLSVKNLIK